MKAVCLLSGGQDSTTCFYWALNEFSGDLGAVSVDYGQRHRVELELAQKTAESAGVEHVVLPLEALSAIGAASLTNPAIPNPQDVTPRDPRAGASRNVYAEERGLPPSFVPGRNVLLFGLAMAWAAPKGADVLVSGVCAQDRAGYPDCRIEFVEAIEQAMRIGLDLPHFHIAAPLLERSKAETWKLASDLGVLAKIILHTHTCYEGDRTGPPKPWGYGCGECPACVERIKGWDEFKTAHPLAT